MNYFDLHCDTITECYVQSTSLFDNTLQWSLKRAMQYAPLAQVFAIWIPDEFRGEAAVTRFNHVYDTFCREIQQNSGKIAFCKTSMDLEDAFTQGRAAAILSIEGGAAIAGNLQNLDRAYEKGVRIMTLTWNGRCEIADGVMEPHAGGLTPFGREVVRRMEQLPMLVDVSHLAEKGFWEVAENTSRPFIASHSNAKSICGHKRNLTDEQFREIVKRSGIVGLNLYRNFLRDDGNTYIRDIARHLDHFLSLGGEQALAIGGDLDGSDLPLDMAGVEDIGKVRQELLKDFPEKTIDAVFFQNAHAFFARHL